MVFRSPEKKSPNPEELNRSMDSVSAEREAIEQRLVAKPFFVLDWLEEMIADTDAEKMSELLQTPQRPKSTSNDSVHRGMGQAKNANRLEVVRRELAFEHSPSKKTASLPDLGNPSKSSSPISTPKRKPKPSSSTPNLAIRSSPFFKKSIAIGNGWNAKGLRKANQGLWEDALACWDNALEIRIQLYGENHLDVANIYNNRGIALGRLEEWDAAIRSLEKALEIRTLLLGDVHLQVAATVHNLANVHHQSGSFEKAIQLFCHSKNVQERADNGKKENQLQIARTCTAIGHIYCEVHQYADASLAYQDAVFSYREAGVAMHDPAVQELQNYLGDLNSLLERKYARVSPVRKELSA